MKKIFFTIILSLFPILLFSQSITSIQLPHFHFKRGEKFSLAIKTSSPFNIGNIFKVELSDKFGNFDTFTEIGRINARTDTTIACQIPDTIPLGNNYLLRISATSPNYISNPTANKIIIYIGKTFFVSPTGDNNNAGTKDAPFKTIQWAIEQAWFYDTILVNPGTYFENINFLGIDVSLISIKGKDSTIIDGQSNGQPVLTFENGESSATIIDGFTIQNGINRNFEGGGGITIRYQNTSPRLKNLKIRRNEASAYGGGIYCFNAGTISIQNCIIEENKSQFFGAGIYSNNSFLKIENSIVRKNNPGGIYNWRSFSNITNSLIYWNNSHEVVHLSDLGIQMTPKIINSTIISKDKFYCYFLEGRFLGKLYNSILFGQDSSIAVVGDAYDTLEMDNNIIFKYPRGAYTTKAIIKFGDNNLIDDPMFKNPSSENFHLDTCSPALGMALKELAPPKDVYGYPRQIEPNNEENPDLGAIESPLSQRSSSVSIRNISNTRFCKGGTLSLDFSVGGCPFFEGNEFIAELSNSEGKFNPSYQIGKIISTKSGTIQCTLPSGIKGSANYKIRIRATKLPFRSEPYPQSITIMDNPSVKIFGSDRVCSSREYTYWTDSTENPLNLWILKNGISHNKLTENSIVVVWQDSGTGSIKLIQTNLAGCRDSLTKTITILSTPPKPYIQQISDGQLLSSYPSFNQWYLNGTPIPGATSRIHKPTKNGYYSVKIIPPHGCESDMSDSIFVTVSTVDELEPNFIVNIYQSNEFILINPSLNCKIYKFLLWDFLGKEIQNLQIEESENILVNTSHLAPGIYFLHIITEKSTQTLRYIKF
ncbi:MAG: T9SS type A sorting domain-containing protein [Ignavibacteria bacterium]|nr:T9SS type A sorting domain-containing protein [Ignavibacteria bacterium]